VGGTLGVGIKYMARRDAIDAANAALSPGTPFFVVHDHGFASGWFVVEEKAHLPQGPWYTYMEMVTA
jgi:hypothetical protein